MTTVMGKTLGSFPLDPEEEAFRALNNTICSICRKKDIHSKDDVRLHRIVARYKDRYPSLTPDLIVNELAATEAAPVESLVIDDKQSVDASALTMLTKSSAEPPSWEQLKFTPPGDGLESSEGGEEQTLMQMQDRSNEPIANAREKELGCWSTFTKKLRENGGYNPLTFAFLLSFFLILMFVTSVIFTYLNYNVAPYRDWALAGGVTSNSAEFRVRGPASDDGKRREFVVSTSSNLAIERHQILNSPVSYADFQPEEHFVRRISLGGLDPTTPYYYGITRPQSIKNSAVVEGSVGRFVTPAPEGTRMGFTIAAGSCALSGSKSEMFTKVLDLEPLLFVHMGDFHYEDLDTTDVDARLEAYDRVMGSPSQRLLYMRTIFSYMYDDHDWLGNNEDSDDRDAAAAARRGYTLGIPHYELGSTSTNEADAAKYQAFTLGTVRFIITDLRSESVRSSEYFSGKVYSKQQKQWLFDEFSRAGEYDFVVWVTTRPWTDPVRLSSDGWGGFVQDRDELAAHIAKTIGRGPRNLLVLSGDNHMVAFDDGSSTDFSGQDLYPGGFPLLHSGPLANYGGLSELFKPSTNFFTDGCKAFSSELNHQFSTVEFYFPSNQACVRMKSYSEDSSNVIFEKEMCGELMKYGTPEEHTCTLAPMSALTMSLYSAAGSLIVLNGALVIWTLGKNGCSVACSYVGIGALFSLLTVGAAFAGAMVFRNWGISMVSVSALILIQSVLGSLFVIKVITIYDTPDGTEESVKSSSNDEEDGLKTQENSNEMDAKALEEDGSGTHEDTFDDSPAHQAEEVSLRGDSVARSVAHSAKSEKSNSKESFDNSATLKMGNCDSATNSAEPNGLNSFKLETSNSAMLEEGSFDLALKHVEQASSEREKTDLKASTTCCPVTERGKSAILFSEGTTGDGGASSTDGPGAEDIIEDLAMFEMSASSELPSAKSASPLAKMFHKALPFSRRSQSLPGGNLTPSVHTMEVRTASMVKYEHSSLHDVEDSATKDEKEEGIEVTNPTNKSTRIKTRVSPKLVEL